MEELNDKIAVVTGSSRGIGRVIAIQTVSRSWKRHWHERRLEGW